MCEGKQLGTIVGMFDKDWRLNDRMMKDFVEYYFGDKLSRHRPVSSQTCCSAMGYLGLL